MSVLIRFMPGDGEEYELPVDYIWAEAPDYQGYCAFCRGNPIGDPENEDAPINKYLKNCPWGFACPFCKGRPS